MFWSDLIWAASSDSSGQTENTPVTWSIANLTFQCLCNTSLKLTHLISFWKLDWLNDVRSQILLLMPAGKLMYYSCTTQLRKRKLISTNDIYNSQSTESASLTSPYILWQCSTHTEGEGRDLDVAPLLMVKDKKRYYGAFTPNVTEIFAIRCQFCVPHPGWRESSGALIIKFNVVLWIYSFESRRMWGETWTWNKLHS